LRSRSVRESNGALDIQHQVPTRHRVHLRIIDVRCGEDGDLRMLPLGEAAEYIAPSSASSETQAESDLFDGPYIHTVKLIRGIPVVTTILRPCAGAASSSPSALSSDQGSSENYPEIGVNTCESSTNTSRLICMVAPNEYQPRHSSSGYPTIGRSEASDARTPSTGLVQNLNPDGTRRLSPRSSGAAGGRSSKSGRSRKVDRLSPKRTVWGPY
jgi:hypothetical protein